MSLSGRGLLAGMVALFINANPPGPARGADGGLARRAMTAEPRPGTSPDPGSITAASKTLHPCRAGPPDHRHAFGVAGGPRISVIPGRQRGNGPIDRRPVRGRRQRRRRHPRPPWRGSVRRGRRPGGTGMVDPPGPHCRLNSEPGPTTATGTALPHTKVSANRRAEEFSQLAGVPLSAATAQFACGRGMVPT